MRALISLALLGATTACGTTAQYLIGWTNVERSQVTETRSVAVTTAPAGAQVVRRDASGTEVNLGPSPITDSHALQFERTVESPASLWIWVGAGLELAAGVGLVAVSSTMEDATFNLGGLLGLAGITDLIVGAVHGIGNTETKNKPLGGSQLYEYRARASGLPEQVARISVPDQNAVRLVLDPRLASLNPASPPPVLPANPAPVSPARVEPTSGGSGSGVSADASWVVAVMDVEDTSNDGRDKVIDRSLVRNLGDQLRVFITQRGVRTVDRGSQERALREQIEAAKKESYKSCYDDSCQVELGKALAASHILRSRITRFGKRCVLNSELIDLKQEVTMGAASSQGPCEAEGFLTMGEDVARNLIKK